ncbi:MAG TPA: SPFH domain-containing protein [Verrucomicrobiae bacterium]|nr:SPFH domain-containing protein [Verrucomicrobiae bacterium]
MNKNPVKSASIERETNAISGWVMLIINLALLLGAIVWFIRLVVDAGETHRDPGILLLAPILIAALAVFLLKGHFTLQPNEARVLILFGAYKGSVRQSGFWWANPLYSRTRGQPLTTGSAALEKSKAVVSLGTQSQRGLSVKISLRARNFNSEKLKVNDKRGNPIEIAAVIVWRVDDTAKAAFDVDDFESYVHIQSESAVRHIASLYAYDRGEEHEPTLRESADEIAGALKKELLERLDKAGVIIEEARLTHLAYAPEIAQAMLRRQQAEAVIAARQKIVHGAVSMVDMALRELSEKGVVKLDEERKASMVSNLLVVLCGETEAAPVINTGTLYQ